MIVLTTYTVVYDPTGGEFFDEKYIVTGEVEDVDDLYESFSSERSCVDYLVKILDKICRRVGIAFDAKKRYNLNELECFIDNDVCECEDVYLNVYHYTQIA